MSISDRIREARKRAGMTQDALASCIGVTKGAIANYENGVSLPKLELLCNLMNTLNVDANYLYQDEMKEMGVKNKCDPMFETLTQHYNSLNDEGKQKLVSNADDLVSSGKYIKTKTGENCG